jgi:uncharacterized membrane protein
METRKRGASRESTDDYDLEANNKGGLEHVATPYSVMAAEPSSGGDSDGIMIAANASPGGDSHLRSLAKGLTWRFVASTTTIIIAKAVTGETAIAFQIGFFEFFAKIGIYYVHERIWARIKM